MIKYNRNYNCFVCSEEFSDIILMQDHIIKSHREGDDFIRCNKCFAPIRDLIAHYRTKHIGCTIPPNTQTRAIIFRDCYRNKKTKFKQGTFFSEKTNKEIYFRSGLELKFYMKLEKNNNVKNYKVENIEIEYFFEGSRHNYIPDVVVEYTDGRIEMWEIKPKSQTKWPKNIAKWNAANSYCKKRNWEFIVVTENALKQRKKK